jgi:uncharacterized membrane protein
MGRRQRKNAPALVTGRKQADSAPINGRGPHRVGPRLLGLGLACVGAAHFTAPAAFDPLTERAFPHETRRWTYRNGVSELLIGLALSARRTRSLGGVGLIAYLSFLATRYTSR